MLIILTKSKGSNKMKSNQIKSNHLRSALANKICSAVILAASCVSFPAHAGEVKPLGLEFGTEFTVVKFLKLKNGLEKVCILATGLKTSGGTLDAAEAALAAITDAMRNNANLDIRCTGAAITSVKTL